MFVICEALDLLVNLKPNVLQLHCQITKVLYEWHAQECLSKTLSQGQALRVYGEDLQSDGSDACPD